MRKLSIVVIVAIIAVVNSCSQKMPGSFILVKGGAFVNSKSNFHRTTVRIPDFYISTYEVTQKEWVDIMGNNPSHFKGDNLPVETVNWYECLDYCNKRSIKEGLQPYYNIDRNKKDPYNVNALDDIKWSVTTNDNSNGYRLPSEAEWQYAAGGGQVSKSYKYSGSDSVNEVAWYWQNSGDKYLEGNWSWPALKANNNKTKPVGDKKPNELGLYDMSGNVREWCWDWQEFDETDGNQGRIWKGGGWMGADFCCEPTFKAHHEANGKGPDQGFRLCRNPALPVK